MATNGDATPRPQQPRLWRRGVFVDWHGVLCDEVFWSSILGDRTHHLHAPLHRASKELFEHEQVVAAWMRGRKRSSEVVESLDVELDRRHRQDYLERRLVDDCRRMTPRAELLAWLQTVRVLTFVAVATDNMDCFSGAASRMTSLQRGVDTVLCSADIGVLKAEDPERFFGPALYEAGLERRDAVLIDDSAENCRRFVEWGGYAIHYRDTQSCLAQLDMWLSGLPRAGDGLET